MSLVDGLAGRLGARLERGRAMAEARMTSRVTVKRRDHDNPTTVDGLEVPTWTIVHVNLPFQLDSGTGDGGSRGVTVGGVTFEEATGVGKMPATTTDLADDDVLEITAGEWAGSFYRVVAAVRYDQKTARRVPLAETQEPEGWSA